MKIYNNRNQKIEQKKIKKIYKKVINNKMKKRSGFTLIEVIAVIAIIGILAAAILPNVSGYIKEAKKVKVVDQSRKVVMAAESYKLKSNSLPDITTVAQMKNIAGVNKYLKEVNLSNLQTTTTLQECYNIVNGAEFDIGDNDVLVSVTSTNP